MKSLFSFYPNASKIYDYLYFPSLVHYNEQDNSKVDNHKDEVPEEFIKLQTEISLKLKPYKNILSKYYYYDDINIIHLLLGKYSFFDYVNVSDYLDALQNLDSKEIVKTIIGSLEAKETGTPKSQEARKLAEELVNDDSRLMSWINKLSYSGETKWQLLTFTKTPKESLNECINTLRSLEGIFLEYYSPVEKKIMDYGEEFILRLNNVEGDALDKITNGTLKNSMIPGEKGHMLISYFGDYSIHIYPGVGPGFIAWGMGIEEIFQKLSKREENELSDRILLFKNLGDKTRYEVLKCIASGTTSTKVIAKELGVSSATISYHISNLTTSKIIVPLHAEGRYIYVVNHETIEKCFKDLKKDLKIT
ncbi:winged helix-turn-helix transcriptional regulator [Alkalicella caledoniensis]|uniref:Winged helix-turn-helix transcriptional regulator n=1 Tax=Alkalicella caledoniensis TaxID=2731377 RepID=A0A7G9W672_ALKCA|nr:winged helix-turn-helix domain-containing protein [Alkalicella caledoniensis]QNO14184.1 winged helix-turn-helix transcriptional regulator [Alkalicella caledoniensis]